MADAAKINDWLQVIGMFGLIASLIFVGMQIRQDRQIALSSIYQARSDASVEYAMSVTNSPEVLNAIAKIYSNKSDELTLQEAVALEYLLGANMTMFENNHQQYLAGFLSQEHWQRNLEELRCELDWPGAKQLVSGWDYRESFEKVLDEIIEQAIQNPTGCWDVRWPYALAE